MLLSKKRDPYCVIDIGIVGCCRAARLQVRRSKRSSLVLQERRVLERSLRRGTVQNDSDSIDEDAASDEENGSDEEEDASLDAGLG
jgi:hypothetical protein